jgi:hypothetical protein
VRELGRPRPLESPAAVGAAAASSIDRPAAIATTSWEPAAAVAVAPARLVGRRAVAGWVAAIAAAVILSVATTSIVVGWRVDQRLAGQASTIEALEEVTTATLAVTARPDARRVVLSSTSDRPLDGTLIYSPSTSDLVVVATGLTPPPDGQEYRCWVELGGQRQRVGKMFFSEGLSYWIGPVSAVAGLSSGATFGVSLVDAAGAGSDGPPVLTGGL